MLTVEVILYPIFCLMACRALRSGLQFASDRFAVVSVVFATVNAYSVLLLAAETLFGSDEAMRTKVVWTWVVVYAPFLFVPALFSRRVFLVRKAAAFDRCGTGDKRE
jgi:hypothetical protein